MKIILSCKNVKKYFGALAALNGVDIDIREGLFNLIIGPNGSGKTTLINVIAGFYNTDEGKIIYEDRDITKLPPHERFKLGLVRTFQIPVPF
jgi:amino acid/amide ABC transporter ATP-binding protein 1, HAAT family (TC 3.A.1.4.-)